MKAAPDGFRSLCGGLHQDINLIAPGRDQWPAHCLQLVIDDERPALKAYLEAATSTLMSSELKSLMKHQHIQVRLNSQEARTFLETVLALLSEKRGH